MSSSARTSESMWPVACFERRVKSSVFSYEAVKSVNLRSAHGGRRWRRGGGGGGGRGGSDEGGREVEDERSCGEETSGSFQKRECLSTQYLLVHTPGRLRDGGICLIC